MSTEAPETATTLEYDPKVFVRVSFQPLGKTQPSAAASTSGDKVIPFVFNVVRFDQRDSCVSGWSPCLSDDGSGVWYSSLDIDGEAPITDWSAVRRRRCWSGYSSLGRFGCVVPIKEPQMLMMEGGIGRGGSAAWPRSITLEPPDMRWSQQQQPQQHSNNNHHRAHHQGGSSRNSPIDRSFVPTHSFVKAAAFGEEGSATAAFLGNISMDDPFLQKTQTAHDMNSARSGAATVVDKEPVERVADTLEDEFGEGKTIHTGLVVLEPECGLYRSCLNVVAPGPMPTTTSSGKNSSSSASDAQQQWTTVGELLPFFFNQKPSVSAASFANYVSRQTNKMCFDQTQFVALIGDSRGLFLITPGRDPTTYCNGFCPLGVEAMCVGVLPRGEFEFGLNGKMFLSPSRTSEEFEKYLPHRLRLPTPVHSIRSVVCVTVETVPVQAPAIGRSNKDLSGSTTSKDAVTATALGVTRIVEKMFVSDDVQPGMLQSSDLWDETVDCCIVLPTHANWGDAVDLTFVAPKKSGGRGKGT